MVFVYPSLCELDEVAHGFREVWLVVELSQSIHVLLRCRRQLGLLQLLLLPEQTHNKCAHKSN